MSLIENLYQEYQQLKTRNQELEQENQHLKGQLEHKSKELEDRFKELAVLTKMLEERDQVLHRYQGQAPQERGPDILQQLGNYSPEEVQAIIEASGLFDAAWYLQHNRDVAASGMDPLQHYVHFGAAEHRNPSGQFHTAAYLQDHPNLVNTSINPLVHYIKTLSST